ncbi:hypothetical protein [Negadavirga shengliensis]|uniref:Uncharacterized protein n=1 Tax=Negadavirga shengliensis TaxID=1389218 RepID=A0ABV9SZY6_9BACT
MQQHWEFNINETKLTDESSTPKKNALTSFLKNEQRALDIFLSYYLKSEGAIAENTEIGDDLVFIKNHQGKFTVKYDKVHYNACLNIHEQDKEKMELNFRIDPKNKILQLTGPEWPEREPDDI